MPQPSNPLRPAVVVIDDEAQIRRAVANTLEPMGFRVLEAATGRTGIVLATREDPALVVLDLGLPDMQGVDVCREIRVSSRAPIVVLSARHSEDQKVDLFTAGADDYITKPFGLREFQARVQARLRRAGEAAPGPETTIEAYGLRIEFARHQVTRAGKPIRLTRLEWKVLGALASTAGRTMTHRQIFESVWGRALGQQPLPLRVHITHLRRKLEPDPARPVLIVTEPGVGYRLQLPADTPGANFKPMGDP